MQVFRNDHWMLHELRHSSSRETASDSQYSVTKYWIKFQLVHSMDIFSCLSIIAAVSSIRGIVVCFSGVTRAVPFMKAQLMRPSSSVNLRKNCRGKESKRVVDGTCD
ncbi:unnamed protein product [Merluccius merluccius]